MNTECKWVRSHLGEFLDGELATDAHGRAKKHLSACVDCRAALALMRGVDRASGEVLAEGKTEAPDALMRSIKARFDLKAAADLRASEMEQEGPGGKSYLSGDEVADQALEASLEHSQARAGVRDESTAEFDSTATEGWLRRVVRAWLNPTPAWRWVQVAGATTAVAVLAFLIFTRDPDLARRAPSPDLPSELPAGATYHADRVEPADDERLKSLGRAAGLSDAETDAGGAEKRVFEMKAAGTDDLETEEVEPADALDEIIVSEPAASSPPAVRESPAPSRAKKKEEPVQAEEEFLRADGAGEPEPRPMSAEPGVRLQGGPGWEHAQNNLLKVLRPTPAQNAMLLKLEPTDLMKEAESQLLVVTAEAPRDEDAELVGAGEAAWGSVKGMFEGSTEAETTARREAGRGMRALPEDVASNLYTRQRVEDRALLSQDIIEDLAGPLPQTAADVLAWRALGDGWYVLWEADQEDADKAKRAAAFYAALVEVSTGDDSPEAASEEMNRQLRDNPEFLTQVLDRLEKLYPTISD